MGKRIEDATTNRRPYSKHKVVNRASATPACSVKPPVTRQCHKQRNRKNRPLESALRRSMLVENERDWESVAASCIVNLGGKFKTDGRQAALIYFGFAAVNIKYFCKKNDKAVIGKIASAPAAYALAPSLISDPIIIVFKKYNPVHMAT